jgi:signal transduction histidine kinase
MDKITLKLIRYFMFIITLIVAMSLLLSSIFLSKFYLKQQYSNLEASAKQIHDLINKNQTINDTSISAILIKDGNIVNLTRGKMGMMPFMRSINDNEFKNQGVFKNGMGDEFLYYKLGTDSGDIVVFQSNSYSSEYLKVVYIILLVVFIFAVILSVPLISFVGKKFTEPILKLEKAASSISKGDFDVDFSAKTNDEIETLSKSFMQMAIDLKKKYKFQRDFIANVSHDFKTPLSVIRSYGEAIYDGLVDEKNITGYSGEIIKEVDRLNALVMDLLQLSKLQDGVYLLNKEFISLPELIDECISKFNPIVDKKHISIKAFIKPVKICADKKYIQRVLYNFIDNSIKFSKENSRVEISTHDVEEGLKVTVRDFGIGIEEPLLEDVWNKYYKNSQSGGMGLGLPICREILKMHGFEYGVTSSKEDGTEFYFIIPEDYIDIL